MALQWPAHWKLTAVVESAVATVYESQASLDLPPKESKRFRATLGMTEDYYTDIPPDPPDDQVNLYVGALMGLTADVR